jgi:hypothetical protein
MCMVGLWRLLRVACAYISGSRQRLQTCLVVIIKLERRRFSGQDSYNSGCFVGPLDTPESGLPSCLGCFPFGRGVARE